MIARLRGLGPTATLVAVALLILLVSAPPLLARHHAENAMPRVRQAVTDTTVERWTEAEAERQVADRLAEAGIDTVVLGMRKNLRYDSERVRQLAELDVEVILAVPTFPPREASSVRAEVRRVADRTGATVLLPQRTQSFGRVPSNASWMREYGLALTDLAGGAGIPGIEVVARPGHVVRAHEIPVGVDDSTAELESRALRAVKERGVRLIVYRYAERQQGAPLDTTMAVAEAVAARLPGGVSAGVISAGGPTSEEGNAERGSAEEGSANRGEDGGQHLVAGASALAEPRPAWSVPAWVGLPAGLLGATAAALLVALPWQGGSRLGTRQSRWRRAGVRLTAALTVTVTTGLLVAASGSSWTQMVGVESFTGVKLLLLGPPLLIVMFGAWRHRHGLLAAATPRRVALAGLLAAAVLGLYLFRSGNVGIAFTPELWLRDQLDDLLYIRPRFKEMLLGLPALTVAALLWTQGPAQRWQADAARWLAAALGAIGTASVVDTFAHFHTPVWVGLLRTGYAIVIGVPLGLMVWWLYSRRRRGGTLP